MANKKIKVLSLCDGIGGALQALLKADVDIDTYYYSEVDRYALGVFENYLQDEAIELAERNINFVNLGDLTKISYKNGRLYCPLHKPIKVKIDLMVFGYPCQSFSISGNQKGFDDPRGKLFFECNRVLKEVEPTYFLAENVCMSQSNRTIIDNALGVRPIKLDSGYLSPQTRNRYYWTNIPGVLNSVKHLQKGKVVRNEHKLRHVLLPFASTLLTSKFYKNQMWQNRFKILGENTNNSSPFGISQKEGSRSWGQRGAVFGSEQHVWALTATDYKQPKLIAVRYSNVLKTHLQSMGLTLVPGPNSDGYIIRNIHPVECERLQGFPDNYTAKRITKKGEIPVSLSQRYKMLGNSFQVDTVAFILKHLPKQEEKVSLIDKIKNFFIV